MVGPCLGCAAVSGTHAPHLQRRSGIFYLRVRVPFDLKLRVGMLEVRRSLQTYSPARARLLAAIYAPRVMEAFRMVRAREFTRDDAKAFVLACFHDLRAEVDDGFAPKSDEPELELLEQQELAKEHIQDLKANVLARRFDGIIARTATECATARGVELSHLPHARQVDVYEGVARALIEQQRLFIARLWDRLSPYVPDDPLFAAEVNCTPSVPVHPSNGETGPQSGQAIAAYLQSGRKKWTEKTYAGRVRQLAYLEEHLGADRPITSVTAHDTRGDRDAVLRLRSNHRKGTGLSFAEKQTENEAHRIQPKTANLIFDTTKAFFRWSKASEGYVGLDPAADVRIEAPNTKAREA